MFRSVLIANRGEIAVRVARTLADRGLRPWMVAAKDERDAPHLRHCAHYTVLNRDGAAAYLDIEGLISAAQQAGCDAVHPGYGFLSESGDFARACTAADLVFIGPEPETLDLLGDKLAARNRAQSLGLPVPGGSGPLADGDAAVAFAQAQNGPVMLKAVMGGGGRGMARVQHPDQMHAAFAQSQQEAQNAFGKGDLFAEELLENVRHIEVQILGDGQTVTHLWDRDCTLQRRSQKLVEIAPAPDLPDDLRRDLAQAALTLGQGVGYRGLATIEFLVDAQAGQFWFIEANPRLQVEHTVTEAISGVDLVAAQMHLAAGARLSDLALPEQVRGQAVQLRINCETYERDGAVMPKTGTLSAFGPPHGPGVRVDTAGFVGYTPHPGFDSLLAKVVVTTPDTGLPALLAKAARVLGEFQIEGVSTNRDALRAVLETPDVTNWEVNTTCLAPLLGQNADDAPQDTSVLQAKMQGMVVSCAVEAGQQVRAGQELVVLEAMKMQHVITAPQDGLITALMVAPGETVGDGAPLLGFEALGSAHQAESETAPPDPDLIRPDLQALQDRTALTLDENRPKSVARRRARGQRTARENIADLCQGGSFHEYGQLTYAAQRRGQDRDVVRAGSPADGIITGLGEINAGQVSKSAAQTAVLAYDGSVMAGTQGMFGHIKTDRLLEVARAQDLPVVFYTEGGGGRPNDHDFADVLRTGLGVHSFHAFARHPKARITVNSGYCFAGNAALFGAGDIRIATRNSWIGLGGPAMIEAGGLGQFDPKDIGPAPMQAQIGGLDLLATDEAEATTLARQALSYFQGALTDWTAPDPRDLRHMVPENRKRVYDIRPVIAGIADAGSVLELGAAHAPGMITALIRMNGRALGLIANNPHHLGGALDAPASAKGARFLRLCRRFDLPVLSLCDTPGFMVGPDSEAAGGVGAACDLLSAGADLQTPLFFVCLRKGYGIGAQAMAGGSFAAPTFTLSWPTGEFGPMGLEGAVTLGHKHELDAAPTPEQRTALFERLVAHSYAEGGALNVASLLEIDAVIDPAETRSWVLKGLDVAAR
ncbi:MAG: carboxyl transferase domain-containing protein [Sedimentitalea sp.]